MGRLVLDSSAVIAVLFEEVEGPRFVEVLEAADLIAIGSPTLVETTMVASRAFDLHGRAIVAQFLERWNAIVTPFDARHEKVATDAFIRYGKGRHPAALNYGDCMTYATARVADLPLLFAGDDFSLTDIAAAQTDRW
jgi:ribonuclease VapC